MDKKILVPKNEDFLEAPPGFEPGRKGFADLCLTTWLWCHIKKWSGLRGSNPLPPPWQGGALPDELNPHISPALVVSTGWCLRSELNQRHGDFQSPALPTELQRHIGGATQIRTGGEGVADLCLTAWLWRHVLPCCHGVYRFIGMERITGLEPATSTLARSRSTK